jgi:peptidoglycan/LPS O-acetylase OafA/YrhL
MAAEEFRPDQPKVETADRAIVSRPQFRADIEGLRAIAILMVVAYHAGVPGFGGGYIGVDVFFVISGYLITWLLVYEMQEKGRIDLIRFYARRMRRLLPAMALVLLVTVGLSALLYASFEQEDLAKTALATATYSSNLHFAKSAVDYLAADLKTNPLLHTWSLSVEEQFYLVWPLLVAFAFAVSAWQQRFFNRPRLIFWGLIFWLSLVTAGSFAISLHLTEVRQPSAFFLSHARAWEFSVGAIALLIPLARFKAPWQALWGWLGCGAMLSAAVFYTEATRFPGMAAVLPTLATVVILRAGAANHETRLAQFFRLPGLQWIGRLSYSWYLWHWPVLVFANVMMTSPPVWLRVGLVALSLIPAIASYHWLENPIRHSTFFSRLPLRSIALGGLITLFGVGLALGWSRAAIQWSYLPEQRAYVLASDDSPAVYDNGCHANFFASAPQLAGCTVGPANASQKVVLLGDSHAAQWHSALADLADTQQWQLTSMTKSACPYVSVTPFLPELGRDYQECDAWRKKAIAEIQKIGPDLAIVSSASIPYSLSPAEWTASSDRTLSALSKVSKRVVILQDTPNPGFNVRICLARNAWRPFGLFQSPCKMTTDQRLNEAAYAAQQVAAQRYKNVHTVEMQRYICPDVACDLTRRQPLVYRDDSHLSVEFTRSLTQPLLQALNAAK